MYLFPRHFYSRPPSIWYGLGQDGVGVVIVENEHVVVAAEGLYGESACLVGVRACKRFGVDGQEYVMGDRVVCFLRRCYVVNLCG